MGIVDIAREAAATTVHLMPGDIALILSDGIYEARNRSGDALGEERVQQWILKNHDRPANEILLGIKSMVENHLEGHPAVDDQTGIILKRITSSQAQNA